jgi:glycosyltransferase involved in cell wall biosynthesis/GR25 family glycosyltransferase involved in LPS biosynthesis
MSFNETYPRTKIICINLRTRRDKRKFFVKQMKNQGFVEDSSGKETGKAGVFSFYKARRHRYPKIGCLTSHLNIIKKYRDSKLYDRILIFEDDAKFLDGVKLNELPPPPENDDWSMLYLGGTVKDIFDYSAIKETRNWVRMSCFTTHAYMINLQNQELIDDIIKASQFNYEIDSYYLEKIHKKYKAYMSFPMKVIQREGYSDIEGRLVNYDFMKDTLTGFQKPESEEVDGNYVMKLDHIDDENYPSVSIITPTFNRRHLFSMAVRNFYEFAYPPDKLEWIIIDNTPLDEEGVGDMFPNKDKRIKYYRITNSSDDGDDGDDGDSGDKKHERFSIAKMRNLGVERSTNDIIVHMDDDDYYPPESVISRVKVLLQYKDRGVGCVGSSEIGIYDIINNASSLSSDGQLTLSEASMAYFKSYWEEGKFDELEFAAEYKSFIQNRFDQIIDMPYSFILVALSHNSNHTGTVRKLIDSNLQHKKTNEKINFYDYWPDDVKLFIRSLKTSIISHTEQQKGKEDITQ